MKTRRNGVKRVRRSSQSGYAFLFALFLMLAMLASSVVVIQNGLTQSKRRREEEMIWRGNQYVRAIRLYFRKTGHYPQDLEALKKGLPQLHFLRQAYKDPMNTTDGAWRFIYVNAAGQIIGSMRYASLQQMALMENPSLMAQSQAFPQLGVSAASLANQSSAFGAQPGGLNATPGSAPGVQPNPSQNPPADQSGQGSSDQSASGQSTSGQGPAGQTTQQPQSSAFGSSGQLGNPILQQKPTGPVDGPVLGAFLTGVASNVDAPSMKILHGAKKYKGWEFIWNPLAEQAAATQQAVGAATQSGLGGALNPFGGANPFGTGMQQPGTNQPGTNPPGPNPPQTPQ
jgi:hypothetical protein